MKKTLGVILLLGVAGLLAAVSVARSASTDGTLQGVVGPGFSITLTQNGTKVTHLDPGTYTISVDDESADHNFHLSGPGVDQTTDVAGTGTTTWTVTFADGTFFYQCDVHSSTMHGSFTVGNVPTTTTTADGADARAAQGAHRRCEGDQAEDGARHRRGEPPRRVDRDALEGEDEDRAPRTRRARA